MTRDLPRFLRRMIVVLMLLAPVPVLAAGFACAEPTDSDKTEKVDDADEVRIAIREGTQSAKEMQAWLKLLVGQYNVEGYVDLCGKGIAQDQRPVSGKVDCIASGSAPDVHCAVNVRWPAESAAKGASLPGGVSNLAPAEFVFSIERPTFLNFKGVGVNGWGLALLQLDNRGIAEWNSGVLVGNAFIAGESCGATLEECHRITRITVNPGNGISMLVDVHRDRQPVLRQSFQLRREPALRRDDQSMGVVR